MVPKPSLMAGLFLMAATLPPHAGEAAAVMPLNSKAGATVDGSPVQQAQYGGYRRYNYERNYEFNPRYGRRYYRDDYGYYDRCRYWRRECADRWGWGGWEFRRCLRRHGCGGGYRY